MGRFWGWALSGLDRVATLVWVCLLLLVAVPVGLACGAILVPWFVCQRWRMGRWLPVVGPLYYSALVTGIAYVGGVAWAWAGVGWVVLLVLCFPPDPFTFFFRPRLRRATFRALNQAERQEGLSVEYERVSIEREEPGRVIVRVGIDGNGIGANGARTRRFLVSDDGAVEPLPPQDEPQPEHAEDRPFA